MPTILSSWKEIAQYLGKGVRTVQRWEARMGLPVHRPCGGIKGVVLAYPSELDTWTRRDDMGSKSAALRRHRELSSQLMEQAASVNSSTRQLLESCQSFRTRLEKNKLNTAA